MFVYLYAMDYDFILLYWLSDSLIVSSSSLPLVFEYSRLHPVSFQFLFCSIARLLLWVHNLWIVIKCIMIFWCVTDVYIITLIWSDLFTFCFLHRSFLLLWFSGCVLDLIYLLCIHACSLLYPFTPTFNCSTPMTVWSWCFMVW